MLPDFSRKRSEGFPFIVGGLGVGPVFAWCLWCRRGLVVVSSWCRRGVVVVSSWPRRRQLVNSLPSGKALGDVFCVFLLLRPKTLIPLSRLREVAPNRVFWACPCRFCVAGAIDLHHLAASCCVFFLRIALSALRKVVPRCKFRRRRGIFWHVMKIDGSLARNVDFEVVSCKNSQETSILMSRRAFVWQAQ